MKSIFLKKFFTKEQLRDISSKITEIENVSSVELRIFLRIKRGLRERKMGIRDIAVRSFFKLGMHKTRHKTGILLYILFSEKKFEIVADEGIYNVVPQQRWDEIAKELSNKFSREEYFDGLLCLLDKIKSIAANNFPREKDDINELPDEIIVK